MFYFPILCSFILSSMNKHLNWIWIECWSFLISSLLCWAFFHFYGNTLIESPSLCFFCMHDTKSFQRFLIEQWYWIIIKHCIHDTWVMLISWQDKLQFFELIWMEVWEMSTELRSSSQWIVTGWSIATLGAFNHKNREISTELRSYSRELSREDW